MLCFRRIIRLGPWQCRLKYPFEFAQGLGARESWLGDPSPAAGRDVQHPKRHFQNPRCLELFQAAMRHRSAAFFESGMHPYCLAMPWMPGIADFTEIPNMGVVLLSCITPREIIKVKRTGCCFLGQLHRSVIEEALDARSV
jgi:hypothetical protein